MEKNNTSRPLSEGAEDLMGKPPIKCLNFGFVRLVDYMGNDLSVVQAARTSYGKGTKKMSDDESLMRYLLRHEHTTPFEMIEIKFHCKMPIFVARHWVRHRTASINEQSARYSELSDEFYIPEREEIRGQSKNNKQCRSDELLSSDDQEKVIRIMNETVKGAYVGYKEMLDLGLAKELARLNLPVNVYTEWYWKVNLHNLFRFLKLRLDKGAQKEIRVYAEAITEIVKVSYPICYKAFEDYILFSKKFSRTDLALLKELGIEISKENIELAAKKIGMANKREKEEFLEKLQLFAILKDLNQ